MKDFIKCMCGGIAYHTGLKSEKTYYCKDCKCIYPPLPKTIVIAPPTRTEQQKVAWKRREHRLIWTEEFIPPPYPAVTWSGVGWRWP